MDKSKCHVFMDHPEEDNAIMWQTDIAMCLPACLRISGHFEKCYCQQINSRKNSC